MKINSTNCNFEREPLLAPFGFKGGYLSELWQSVVKARSTSGKEGLGLGVQSVLWSDSKIFTGFPESVGNSIMYITTAYAMKKAEEIEWETPVELIDRLLEPTYEYARKISGHHDLRLTFALNALVAVDNAAWQLYAAEKKTECFDELLKPDFRAPLSFRHTRLASIPLISYGVSAEKIKELIKNGYFFLKIKIGSDPDKDGSLDKMLEWDKRRLSEIHEIAKNLATPYTENGKIPYYLDANGRYNSKDRLKRFLDHAARIGALDRIMIMEEPFPEELEVDVSDIPVRLAADESAHSDKDALARIQMGYKAIALKPIAKTMSMSLKIAKLAHENNIPCFCADLTVNPVMVDWNRTVAARLEPLPGMKTGVLESNGHQNYKNWGEMKSYHPCAGASWLKDTPGLFTQDESFFAESGGIFKIPEHYSKLVK
jgi:L-alanine-DL-glutamate epimerase-like enolase superfamily enzyme